MTRRQRRHERRRAHERFTRARKRAGREKVSQSYARAIRKRELKTLRAATAASATGIGALPKRRPMDLGEANGYRLAKAFHAGVSGSGPRAKQRRPVLTWFAMGTDPRRGTGSLKYAIRQGLMRPHGRPRGTW